MLSADEACIEPMSMDLTSIPLLKEIGMHKLDSGIGRIALTRGQVFCPLIYANLR
jgi:hypothetical protein